MLVKDLMPVMEGEWVSLWEDDLCVEEGQAEDIKAVNGEVVQIINCLDGIKIMVKPVEEINMYIRVIDADGEVYCLTQQDLECIAMELDIDDDDIANWYHSINQSNWLKKIHRNLFDDYKQWKGIAYPDDQKFYKE